MDRRSFFKVIAGAAALPIVAKLPLPAKQIVERAGAWATVKMQAGAITSVTIVSSGSGYTSPPAFPLTDDVLGFLEKYPNTALIRRHEKT